MFYIGQHVLCVNDDVTAFGRPGVIYSGSLDGLTKGTVYTVRGIVDVPLGSSTCPHGLYIEEIIRKGDCFYAEAPFAAARFRPLKPLTTEQFTKNEEEQVKEWTRRYEREYDRFLQVFGR